MRNLVKDASKFLYVQLVLPNLIVERREFYESRYLSEHKREVNSVQLATCHKLAAFKGVAGFLSSVQQLS